MADPLNRSTGDDGCRWLLLYHRTAAAQAIMREGFRDGRGHYLTEMIHEGVFLSDLPVDINDGAQGEQLLTVCIAEQHIAWYEFVDVAGLSSLFREWCIPARLLNEVGTTRLLSPEEAEEAEVAGWAALRERDSLRQARLDDLGLDDAAACLLSNADEAWTLWPDGEPWRQR